MIDNFELGIISQTAQRDFRKGIIIEDFDIEQELQYQDYDTGIDYDAVFEAEITQFQ